jgi:hypothetical protein
LEGSHEKGGVEGEIGRFRRRHLVPVPKVASLAELNDLIAAHGSGKVVDGRCGVYPMIGVSGVVDQ